ncbi:MAG: helix-turn-helix domain-containing protein [Rhodobacteraceae bacterium]|nr:helix-turn-helix domain-containing protein [Paracoccaceae bacterium]
MSRSALTGTRIRARRTLRGLRQTDLARMVGVSPSYLNLIEHNRRKVSAPLLGALAQALGVSSDVLVEDSDTRLVEGARAAALRSDTELGDLERIDDFIGRFPGWAAVLAETHGRVERLERVVEQLNDRMTHDPYLGDALHEIISAVTSVQSTAAILNDDGELAPEWQDRFHRNILTDSGRLAEGAVALVNYIDSAKTGETGIAAPQEEVEAWLAREGYHIDLVERGSLDRIEPYLDSQVELASGAAQQLAAAWLAQMQADARALPLKDLGAALGRYGVAPDLVAAAFGCGLDVVLRRLAHLPRGFCTELGLPPMGLAICDMSGTLLFRRPAEGFPFPRFGGGCPLWPLYQALRQPHVPLRANLVTAGRSGRRFNAFAIACVTGPARLSMPPVLRATMLLLPDEAQVDDTAIAVGASCRTCPQLDCPARREPSILVAGA